MGCYLYNPSNTLISADQLMIIGGIANPITVGYYSPSYSVNVTKLFNLQSRKWKNLKDCNKPRHGAGVHFDKEMKKVYLGGGYYCSDSKPKPLSDAEYYDIKKKCLD